MNRHLQAVMVATLIVCDAVSAQDLSEATLAFMAGQADPHFRTPTLRLSRSSAV
jgi:hypothetical protein